MELKVFEKKVGVWETKVSNNSLSLPKRAKEEALEIINQYAEIFPREDVWVQEKFQVPSLILSMNCVAHKDLHVYSINPNPKNLGIAVTVNDELKNLLEKTRKSWPEIRVVFHPFFQDDHFWANVITLQEALQMNFLSRKIILIRNLDLNHEYSHLSERAASTIFKRNVNSYGENLNMWQKIDFGNSDKLPWNKGFALKPLFRGKSIFNIYSPQRLPGIISENKAEDLISNRSFYVQRFINPMNSPIPGELMIYKIFFAYDISEKKYRYLGGVWLSRANYRIHGTPETTFGKLV